MFQLAYNNNQYGTILQVILLTGLRESEAIGLTWDCVDFERGRLIIEKQLQKHKHDEGGFVFSSLKNDTTRVLTPAPYVMALLKQHYKEQAQDKEKAGSAWIGWKNERERKKALVFTNPQGRNLNHKAVYICFKKMAAQIGAPDTKVHDLRRTFAMVSLQNGDDVKTVQGNLSHATASFTLDVYGHISEEMKRASASRMEQYVQTVINP